MIIEQEIHMIGTKEVLFRCAEKKDAELLSTYLAVVSEETPYLRCDPDEMYTGVEESRLFLQSANDSPRELLILVFVDGEFAGNGSFSVPGPSRRNYHRAELGVALFERYTGMGIGTLLMHKLMTAAREAGFSQCELTVTSNNEQARRLYAKLGFEECGRIPMANKYADGTYSDDIFMVFPFI